MRKRRRSYARWAAGRTRRRVPAPPTRRPQPRTSPLHPQLLLMLTPPTRQRRLAPATQLKARYLTWMLAMGAARQRLVPRRHAQVPPRTTAATRSHRRARHQRVRRQHHQRAHRQHHQRAHRQHHQRVHRQVRRPAHRPAHRLAHRWLRRRWTARQRRPQLPAWLVAVGAERSGAEARCELRGPCKPRPGVPACAVSPCSTGYAAQRRRLTRSSRTATGRVPLATVRAARSSACQRHRCRL